MKAPSLLHFAILFCLLFHAAETFAAKRAVTIAVILDGPWERNDEVLAGLKNEILEISRADFDVRFPEEKQWIGDWTLPSVRTPLDRALSDREVDLVLALGVLVAHEAAHRSSLPKPVVAAGVIDVKTQEMPFSEGTSGVRNLAYVTVPSSYERDLRAFLEIVPFQKVAILVNRHIEDPLPKLTEQLKSEARNLGLEPHLVPVGTSAAEALGALPPGVEAVYIMPLFQLSTAAIDSIIRGINARKLPSFSARGEEEVRRGVLGAATEGIFPRLTRRLAITVHRILLGSDAGTLPVTFDPGQKLFLNVATARAIDISPPWSVLTEAELIGEEEARTGRRLTLAGAVREALTANRDLHAQRLEVASGSHEIGRARSALLPQIDVDLTGSVIDEDRAATSFGSQAERSLDGNAALSQTIFSEPALANLSIQKSLQAGRERELDAVRLGIIESAAGGYLDVLRAVTFERIQKENLRLTRHHLELARTREAVGTSGRADVYRWESELATNRKTVIDANASRNLAEMELNRLLSRPSEEPIILEEANLETEAALGDFSKSLVYLENKMTFKRLREFFSSEAIESSPEMKQLDAAYEAARRREKSASRAFWMPSLGLRASISQNLADEGAGSEPPATTGLLDISTPDDTDWNVAAQLSYPLFQGGARRAEKHQARDEVSRVEEERNAVRERIDQSVRAALHLAGASHAGIRESRAAADAARKNLDLVADAYSRGAISLIDLLDAQNAYVVADEAAENSVYDFLADMIEVQRAVGRFDFLAPAEEREAHLQKLESFMRGE